MVATAYISYNVLYKMYTDSNFDSFDAFLDTYGLPYVCDYMIKVGSGRPISGSTRLCNASIYKDHMCKTHYKIVEKKKNRIQCSEILKNGKQCSITAYIQGLCKKHYKKYYKQVECMICYNETFFNEEYPCCKNVVCNDCYKKNKEIKVYKKVQNKNILIARCPFCRTEIKDIINIC